MLVYTISKTDEELLQILELQKNNLPDNLSDEQMASGGFVTLRHTLDLLKKQNAIEQNIIAKDHNRVIAYVLALTVASRFDMPVLFPMFDAFDELEYDQKKISSYKYIVVGQVCVAADYRGKGVFDKCYYEYKNRFAGKYDFAITEISTRNYRSKNAHHRIGFKSIHNYIDPDGAGWEVVLWDWRKINPFKTNPG